MTLQLVQLPDIPPIIVTLDHVLEPKRYTYCWVSIKALKERGMNGPYPVTRKTHTGYPIWAWCAVEKLNENDSPKEDIGSNEDREWLEISQEAFFNTDP